MPSLSRAEASQLTEVKRLCYAGLDTGTFRERVMARLAEHLGADAAAFAILDPETGFLVHTLATGCSEARLEEFASRAYLRTPAADPGLIASSDRRVRLLEELAPEAEAGGDPALEILLASGLRYEVQVSLAAGGKGWATWCSTVSRTAAHSTRANFPGSSAWSRTCSPACAPA